MEPTDEIIFDCPCSSARYDPTDFKMNWGLFGSSKRPSQQRNLLPEAAECLTIQRFM